MKLHVFRRIKGKLKTHIVERTGDDNTTSEVHAPPHSITSRHGSLGCFCCRDMKSGIHHVARKLNIRSILDNKSLERNNGQRVFHLAITQGVFTRQLQIVGWIVGHAQRAATHQVNIVGMVGIKIGYHVCAFRYFHRQIHIEACQVWTIHHGLRCIAKVCKLHQFVKLVVGR